MAENAGAGRGGAHGGDVARTVPGGTTRNTGGVRTGIVDHTGQGTGQGTGHGARRGPFGGRRWLVPVGFVLILLALLLVTLLPSA